MVDVVVGEVVVVDGRVVGGAVTRTVVGGDVVVRGVVVSVTAVVLVSVGLVVEVADCCGPPEHAETKASTTTEPSREMVPPLTTAAGCPLPALGATWRKQTALRA